MTDSSSPFARLLEHFRLAAGLTQRELAGRAGLSARGISNLERGVRRFPYRHTVEALADALQLSPEDRDRFLAAARVERRLGRRVPLPGAPLLAGRDAELDAIEQHLAGTYTVGARRDAPSLESSPQREGGSGFPAGSGRPPEVSWAAREPPLLLLAGEPGIGKTRLLQEAAVRARRRGLLVLEGGCDRHGSEEPYAPFPAMLAGAIDASSASNPAQLLAGCEWVVRLLPDLAGPDFMPPAITLPAGQERRLIFSAVRRLLGRLAGVWDRPAGGWDRFAGGWDRPAGTPPILLLLDDLQWAGAGALDLLTFLLGDAGSHGETEARAGGSRAAPTRAAPPRTGPPRTGPAGLRAIGAYRDTEIGAHAPLRPALSDLADRELVRQLALPPLDGEASAALLEELLPDGDSAEALRRQIVARAGGVPFFLISCAQNAGSGEVPWTVAQSVRGRVTALAPAARAVLEAAAVVGREVRRDVLLAALDLTEEEALRGLDEACAARLLAVEGSVSYRFTHDLIREAIEAEIGAARAAALHRRLAGVLAASPRRAGAAEIGRHFRAAGEVEPALVWTMRAGDDAAAALVHDAAEEQYRQAAKLAGEAGDSASRAAALERCGRVLLLSGRYDDALAVLAEAVSTYGNRRDLDGEGRVIALIGMAWRELGRPNEAIARLEPMITRLTASGPSVTLARLQVTLAHALYVAGRYQQSAETAQHAADLARGLDDERTLAEAGARLGACLTNLCRNDEAVPVLEDAAARAERSGDIQVCAIATTNLGVAYAVAGRHTDRLGALRRALTLIEQLGDPNWLALALTNLSEALIDVGDWAQGRALLERARALCPPGGSWTAPSALGVLAKLNAWQGRWAETHALLEECLRAAGAGSDGSVLHGIRRGLAEIDLLEGRPEATILRLEPLLHGHAEEDLNAVYGLPLLAHAYLQTGNLGGARHAADTAVRLLRSSPGVASMAFQARALVAVAESRWQEAEDALSEALRVAREWGSPYSEALVLLDIGLLRVRRGDPAAGRDLITRALETLRRLDAAPAVQRAEEALAALA